MMPIRFGYVQVTLEARSPLMIGGYGTDDSADVRCVTDANGLPMLPGTSLAGVLRAALERSAGIEAAEELFGYQKRDVGQRSTVFVGHGLLHDATDRPVDPRPRAADEDWLLQHLQAGILRDHVRLDGNGVADTTGKFDERLVPAGARWTFTLITAADSAEQAATRLQQLLAPLAAEELRVGGRTRRGLGAVKVARTKARWFDLCRTPDRTDWQAIRGGAPLQGASALRFAAPVGATDRFRVALAAEDFWMFGRGPEEGTTRKERIQITPVQELRVQWQPDGAGERAELVSLFVAPATGIKGALRHRSLYHARRLAGAFAPDADRDRKVQSAVDALFGWAKQRERRGTDAPRAAGPRGAVGRVWISDGQMKDAQQAVLAHVSIDRFTGAPMDGRLFRERPLFGGQLTFDVGLDRAGLGGQDAALGLRALAAALEDVGAGRLPLGGGTGRGLGVMRGIADFRDHVSRLRGIADEVEMASGGVQ